MKIRFLTAIISLLAIVASATISDTNKTDANGKKQGRWIKRDAKGKIVYEGNFIHDAPAGEFRYYWDNEKLKAHSFYSDNGKTCRTTMYFYDGKTVMAEGKYIDKQKDSVWKYYTEDSALVSIDVYTKAKKNGVCKTFYPNGQAASESNWENGIETGIWKEFYDNGQLKIEKFYMNGLLEGEMKLLHMNGKPGITGAYKKGLAEGLWLYYNDNGSVKYQEIYKAGKVQKIKHENEIVTEYYDKKMPKSITSFESGMKNGEFSEYYETGEYKQTLEKGENGMPDEMVMKLVGQQLKRKGTYKNNRLHGSVIYYTPEGKLEKIEKYSEGVLTETKKTE